MNKLAVWAVAVVSGALAAPAAVDRFLAAEDCALCAHQQVCAPETSLDACAIQALQFYAWQGVQARTLSGNDLARFVGETRVGKIGRSVDVAVFFWKDNEPQDGVFVLLGHVGAGDQGTVIIGKKMFSTSCVFTDIWGARGYAEIGQPYRS